VGYENPEIPRPAATVGVNMISAAPASRAVRGLTVSNRRSRWKRPVGKHINTDEPEHHCVASLTGPGRGADDGRVGFTGWRQRVGAWSISAGKASHKLGQRGMIDPHRPNRSIAARRSHRRQRPKRRASSRVTLPKRRICHRQIFCDILHINRYA